MARTLSRAGLLGTALLLAACGGGGGVAVDVDPGGDAGSVQVAAATNSYYSSARTLIDRYCVACHHEGGSAPFALESYSQVRSKLSAMVYVLENDFMPPAGHADLHASELEQLLEWLNDGAPEGDYRDAPIEQPTPYTYYGDVKPIFDDKCIGCHVDGGIAPFALTDYEVVYKVRAAAAYAVGNGSMPPWPPTAGFTEFAHDRSLTPEERFTVLNWFNGGAPEGEPGSAPVAAVTAAAVAAAADAAAADTSGPGPNFNLQLNWAEPYTPTLRPDDHRCFAIPWPEQEFTYVTNVDVIPDQVAEVHHVIVSVAEPEDVPDYESADGADGYPGWYCLGAGGVEGAPLPRQIGGWVPGAGRDQAPAGTGVGIEPGSLLIVQMHYNTLATEPTADRSTVLIATQDEVERPARGFLLADPRWLRAGGMPIEAGDPDASHQMFFPASVLARLFGEYADVSAEDPWVLHQGFMHMHNLGKSGRTTLLRSDGTQQVILDIRDWDFNWQGTYNLAQELLVQPTDIIKLECSWDNSAANQAIIDGVQRAPQYVEWGDNTDDEMCLMSILMTLPQAGYDYTHRPRVYIESPAYRQVFKPGDLVPLRLLFNNFSLHDPGEHDHESAHLGGEHAEAADDHGQVYRGHYHVYLDTDDDDAAHLTAWDDIYYYQLPEDISPGLHTLRVSLRAEDHHPIAVQHQTQIEILDSAASAATSLIDVDAWSIQDAASDSLASHRPATVECPDNSWYNEDGALEVETGYCNYLSLSQPSLAPLQSGDTLHLVLWHGQLRFDAPALAHAAISVDGELVWEEQVNIPSGAGIFDLRLPVDFDAPAGSKVEYHLHNHGYNSWTLLKLDVER